MLSQEQRELRSRMIGSSDAASILGLNERHNAADVWLEKTGRAESFRGNKDTERGNVLEPAIITWLEGELSVELRRSVLVPHASGLLCANLDSLGEYRGGRIIGEAKSSVKVDDWGPAGTDDIPETVMVQVHHQMGVAEIPLCYVAVLLPVYGRFEFRSYPIEQNKSLSDFVLESGINFMEKYVKKDIRPPNIMPHLDTLKRFRRTPNKTVSIPAAPAQILLKIKEQRLLLEKAEKDAEAALLDALGDAERGTYAGGEFTYLKVNRKGYTVEPTAYRQLRHKAAKEK